MIDTRNENMAYNPDIMRALAVKKLLTVDEASYFSGIGIQAIRKLIQNDPNFNFVVYNGVKALIKRNQFEKYIDDLSKIV